MARLSLVDLLDAEALRACRVLSSALGSGMPYRRAAIEMAAAVGDRLAALLNATPWVGAAEPFLALVHGGSDEVALDRARRTAGDARVDTFLASLRSQAPQAPATADALTDRAALERLLAGRGLKAHAHRLAYEIAEVGLLLMPGDGRSHLGGPAALPPGEPWPETADGVPLTFLAAIDLAETGLPHSGWLLFFASLDADEAEFGEDAPNAPGSPARVLFAAEPVPAGGPALNPRPLELRPVLTLSGAWDAPKELGLDVYEGETYRDVVDALAELLPPAVGTDLQWFGGRATGIQGFTPAAGTILLLHLGLDDPLGFSFLDAGVLQFRIPADALAAGDWRRIVAFADSC